LRENLEAVDEQIENARVMSGKKPRKGANSREALQWAKILRDLVEVRNQTLTEIKAHLLGRDQTGAITQPSDHYTGNPEIMFERDFQKFLNPWRQSDLNLECEDCGVENQEVETRRFNHTTKDELGFETTEHEYVDLCGKCYEKRLASTGQPEQ
jgi:hypothetical protein